MKRYLCGNARDWETLVRSLGIEIPTKRREVPSHLQTDIDGPPERRLRGNDGSTVVELQTHVGNVKARSGIARPCDPKGKLEL